VVAVGFYPGGVLSVALVVIDVVAFLAFLHFVVLSRPRNWQRILVRGVGLGLLLVVFSLAVYPYTAFNYAGVSQVTVTTVDPATNATKSVTNITEILEPFRPGPAVAFASVWVGLVIVIVSVAMMLVEALGRLGA
jgi:hypothetical protein